MSSIGDLWRCARLSLWTVVDFTAIGLDLLECRPRGMPIICIGLWQLGITVCSSWCTCVPSTCPDTEAYQEKSSGCSMAPYIESCYAWHCLCDLHFWRCMRRGSIYDARSLGATRSDARRLFGLLTGTGPGSSTGARFGVLVLVRALVLVL